MEHSEMRRMAKMRHEKNVVHGDVHKHLEHEMMRHKHKMAAGGSVPPAFRSTHETNGPTAQLKHSMENFTPTKIGGKGMRHGGRMHKEHE